MWRVQLRPRGSVSPELRSDTLFGCIAWAAVALEGPTVVQRWLTAFDDGDPPFLLSSAFPFCCDAQGKHTYFFPRPLHWQPRLHGSGVEVYRARKKAKRLRLLPFETFAQIVKGDAVDMPEHTPPPLEPEPVLHNRIDRIAWGTREAGRLFYQEQLFLPPGTGLYFLLKIRHEDQAPVLRAALHLLGHLGWGGDSGRGLNHFSVEIEENFALDLPEPPSTHFVTLSLYYPTDREREHYAAHSELCWYDLTWRRGKIGGRLFPSPHFWKRAVNYFVEGSVLPVPEPGAEHFGWNPLVKAVPLRGPLGEIPQVRSYGIAFAVPAKVTGAEG